MKKVLFVLPIAMMLLVNLSASASGKQFRPPHVSVCDIDPDGEKCREMNEKKMKNTKKDKKMKEMDKE